MERLLVFGLLATGAFARQLPDFVKRCAKNDPKLNECFIDSFNSIIPKLDKPLPQMGLRQLEPLIIEKLDMNLGNSSSLAFNAVLNELQLTGLSGIRATKVNLDVDKYYFRIESHVPRLHMVSKYRAKGKVLLAEFDSTGTFTGEFSDVQMVTTGTGIVSEKGPEHPKYEHVDVDLNIKTIKMEFENLLPREDLNKNINMVINENINVLYDEIKPVVAETIRTIIMEAVNNIHSRFKLSELYS